MVLNDADFMRQAIAQARRCEAVATAYNVGAVLVASSGAVLATGFSRELPGNTHAEECCLLKLLAAGDAEGSTVYTTMEPCGERLSGKTPCAHLLADAKVSRVVVGIREPPNFIANCQGTDFLRARGIAVDYLDEFKGS